MIAEDIINQLAKNLPKYTSSFNDTLVASISSSSTIVTVNTSPSSHGLVSGSGVVITGSQTPILITKLTRNGKIATAECGASPPEIPYHDLTEFIPKEVIIDGASDSNFNGVKKLLSVPNRKTFTFLVEDLGSTIDTGTPKLLNGSSIYQNYNGIFEVTSTPTPQTFTYNIPNPLPNPSGNIIVNSNIRVSGSVEIDRAIKSYTEQIGDKTWMFVVLGDTVASKDKSNLSDAISNQQRQQQGENFRQQVISTVSIFVIIPSSSEIGGRKARDTAQLLFRPICQSILNFRFNSGLYNGVYNSLQFSQHGSLLYNSSYYVHQYDFFQVEDLQFEDTVGYSDDVAFRNISLTSETEIGSEQLIANIDLDSVPL